MTVNIFSKAIPKQINYQAVLKDASGNLLAGDFAMTIKIYDAPKTAPYYGHTSGLD